MRALGRAHEGLQSRRTLKSRVASGLPDVGLTADEWNALAALGATNTIFQTHQWTRSWLAAFGERYRTLFVIVTDGERVAGVAPLMVDRTRSFQRTLRFVGHGRADYCDVLGGSRHRDALAAVLDALETFGEWDIAKLGNVPAASPTIADLRALCADRRWHILVRDQFACPALLVREHEEDVRRILRKRSLRRPHNYFTRVGRVAPRDLTTRREIEPLLDHLFTQHVERRRLAGHRSLFRDPSNRRLYQELTANLEGTGWLLFSVIELEGRPIACHFGFDYNGVVTWYKPSFDVAHAARSPGLLMVRHLIDYTLKHGRDELDFTIGDEPFKRRFTNTARQTAEILISRSRLRLAANRAWNMARSARRTLFRR